VFKRSLVINATVVCVLLTATAAVGFADDLRIGGPRAEQIAEGVSLELAPQTSNYLEATATATRVRKVLNGVWEWSNSGKLPALDPNDENQQQDPLAAGLGAGPGAFSRWPL